MGIFLLIYPPNSPKNENSKKIKKTNGDIIILHKCTKDHDHMLYCFRDMVCDRCYWYFSFWAIFCPFIPLTAPKNENSKKTKKTNGDIIILHKCTKDHDHMLYCFRDMVCDRCYWYFSFWAIFCPFIPLTAQKMKKTPRDIII